MTPVFKAKIVKAVIKIFDLSRFESYKRSLEGELVEVIVQKPSKKRSDRQNRYYHGVIKKMVSERTGYSHNETHEILKLKFNWKEFNVCGTVVRVGMSTTLLSTTAMEKFNSDIRQWASLPDNQEGLDLYIPTPNEVDF